MVWLLEHQQKYEEALSFCDKALGINPTYVYALSYKGKLLFSLEKFEESLQCYNKALELEPTNSTAMYYRSKIIIKLEKMKKRSFFGKFK